MNAGIPERDGSAKSGVCLHDAQFHHDYADRSAFGCQITDIGPGFLEITQPYRHELSYSDGTFQAGAVGTLADFAGAGACVTMLPEGWGGATADYTIKLLAPATGENLNARGRLIQFGRTLSVAAAEVYSVRDHKEVLCATALITGGIFPKAGATS